MKFDPKDFPPTINFGSVGFDKVDPEFRYVAFIDVLGFGQKVIDDFDQARENYNDLVDHLGLMNASNMFDVTIRMHSDSIYLVSDNPSAVIRATNWIQHGALWCCSWLVRGMIAAGRHQELGSENNLYVVSEPLVHAAKGEQTIKHPCVALHSSAIPDQLIFDGGASNFERSILYYDNQWIVNPFNPMWGTSAAERVNDLKRTYPEHSSKYDWFLGLYKAVKSGDLLLPDHVSEAGRKLRQKAKEK